MSDTIFKLPEIFFDGQPADTNIFFYETNNSSRNNRVSFSQNMICIMQAGEKEISGPALTEMFTNDNLYILSTGNVLMTENTALHNTYKSILLFFSNKFLLLFLKKYNIAVKRTADTNHCVKVTKDEYLLNFERSLEILKNKLTSGDMLKIKIEELLLYLLQKDELPVIELLNSVLNGNKHASLTKVIHANLDNNLSIEELAFLCNMSLSTFKRKFAETFHTTPKQYFIAHKMQKAVAMLREHKRPSEIYSELGYQDLAAFSNEFRKHFGISPSQYIP